MVLSSFSAPTNIDIPIPDTFNLMASSNETTISSLESSPKILGPPETLRQIEDWIFFSTQFLSMPLVIKRQSAKLANGAKVFLRSSRPVVGP